MAINYYSVLNHLTEEGWKLISDSYKNLNTELEMRCPEGHTQFITYGQWRKNPVCEKCLAGDPYKVKKNKVPIKKIDTYRILALDAATKITGYAIYDDNTLVSYGIYKANEGLDTTDRINEVKHWLIAAIDTWQPDFIGIENIQLQSYGSKSSQVQVKTFQTLANLQGVILDTIFEACIDHTLVYVNEWRSYCGISGGDTHREAQKQAAKAKVKIWYDIECTEDEADAICIGKYLTHYLKSSWGENI